jgi:Tfp pilus assembly protein PilW
VLTSEGGFTLNELVMVVALVAMVVAGTFILQQQGQWAYIMGAARVNTQQNARLALDLLVNELRTSSGVTSAPNCNNATSGGTSISFTSAGATITYQLSGTDLRRTDGTGTSTLIGGVQTLNIWCYQTDGVTLTATAASVASVLVKLSTQDETVASAKQHAVVQSRVRLRNI